MQIILGWDYFAIKKQLHLHNLKKFKMKKLLLIISIVIASIPNQSSAQLVVTTLAGSTGGSADGVDSTAHFFYPTGIAYDGNGNLFVADRYNNEIRKVVISTGVVTTFAGSTSQGSADGTGTAASFDHPTGLTCDGNGNLFVADQGNNEIRQIVISTGVVSTLAGSTAFYGSTNGTGAAASFYYPSNLACDGSGNLYVADAGNYEIRKIVISTAVVTTFAGAPSQGHANGVGTAATFNWPAGIVYDGSGNLFIGDSQNNLIRKIVISTAMVSTVAGSTTAGSTDGTGASASFNYPEGLACDGNGNLFVADVYNNEIRKIVMSTGVVSTFAGSTTPGSANGPALSASFNDQTGVACDASGNVYVADEFNSKIRKIGIAAPSGIQQFEFQYSPEFRIYPNPANNEINLSISQFDNMTTSSIEIFNTLGESVKKLSVQDSPFKIDISDLNAGIYFITLASGKTVSTKKFVLSK